MTTKIVIIIPNEDETYLNQVYVEECERFHQEKLLKYCDEVGIFLDQKERENSQLSSKHLAREGFCTILCDENRDLVNMVIFLPKIISDKQYSWFKKRLVGLERYELFILNYTNENRWELIENTTTDEKIINVLNNLLEEKHKNNKKKVRKLD